MVKEPEIPLVNYPKNFPEKVAEAFSDYINKKYYYYFPLNSKELECNLKPQKQSPSNQKSALNQRSFESKLVDKSIFWAEELENITNIKKAFEDNQLTQFWISIYEKSDNSAIKFVRFLVTLDMHFDDEKNILIESDKKISQAKELYKEVTKFSKKIKKYRDYDYNGLWGESFKIMMLEMDQFLDTPSELFDRYKKHVIENDLDELNKLTLTRKSKSPKARHIYYIGADILTRLSLDDEFKTASGKYYDNDSRKFTDLNLTNTQESQANLIKEIELIISSKSAN